MKLREHPGMCYRGIANWPPVWTQASKEDRKTLRGEVGVLEYVYANDRISNKCFLVIRHDGQRYVGCLIFADRAFCHRIVSILTTQFGRSISEIGDLDLAHTL